MRERHRRALVRAAIVGVAAASLPLAVGAGRTPADVHVAAAGPPGAADHLRAVVARSPAPDYRRFGSPGMVRVADYATAQLRRAGYHLVRHDVGGTRFRVDYGAGRRPAVRRVDDGRAFRTEAVFELGATTGPQGVRCVVRPVDQVRRGDCGLVPFSAADPEWNNALQYDAAGAVARIAAAGGRAAIVQGDVANGRLQALRIRASIPAVVALVDERDVLGRTVVVRVVGGRAPAVARNVVAVRRPPPGSSSYVMLLAHADGWFQAAADNGSGTAASLRAADLLTAAPSAGTGVVVALVDGEEVGYVGSRPLAAAMASRAGFAVGDGGPPLRMDDLVAVVNLDASSARASDVQALPRVLLGRDLPVFQWRLLVTSEVAGLAPLAQAVYAAAGVHAAPMPSRGAIAINGSWRTDAGFWHAAGVPVVWPVAGYPEYHTDGDTLTTVDAADLEALAAGTADLLRTLAAAPPGRVPPELR